MKPFDFAIRIQRPGQGHFALEAFADQTVPVFVDGSFETPPLKWQGSKASWACLLSHQRAVHLAIESGADRTVIFEADAEPALPLVGVVAILQDSLDRLAVRDPSWGVIYLGGFFPPSKSQIVACEGIVQTDGVALLHAYALSASGLRAAAEVYRQASLGLTMWPYGHCDKAMLDKLNSYCSVYAVQPFLFGQSEHVSELTGRLCSYPIPA